jgi:hypothetical protein
MAILPVMGTLGGNSYMAISKICLSKIAEEELEMP